MPFFLPYTKLDVPLKFILSDFFLLAFCAVLAVCRLREGDWRLPRRYAGFLLSFGLLFAILLASGAVAEDEFRFFASLLRWFYIGLFLCVVGFALSAS